METIETEILKIYQDSFRKAVKLCQENGMKMKILSEQDIPFNQVRIKVETESAHDFYHLGKTFGTLRQEV